MLKEEELTLPTESDLLSAVLSLERLQNTYNLSSADLIRLRVNGVKYEGNTITPLEAYEIGRQLYGSGRFARAIEWLEESLEGMEDMGYLINAVYYLSYAYYKSGFPEEAALRFQKLADLVATKNATNTDIAVQRNKLKLIRKLKIVYNEEVKFSYNSFILLLEPSMTIKPFPSHF